MFAYIMIIECFDFKDIFVAYCINKLYEKADQSDNSCQCMLSFNTSRFSRLFFDWLGKHLNSDITPYKMSLVVSVSAKIFNKKIKQTSNFS
jgi:predicted small integral membrane protein